MTDRVTVYVNCPLCGEESQVQASPKGLEAWDNGELIQNAMPELSPSDRELLMTGICSDCWTSSFGED